MISRRTRLVVALVASALPLASCIRDDGDCPGVVCGEAGPPIETTVRDVVDAAVTVTRQDGVPVETSCGNQLTNTHCQSAVATATSPVGVYDVHVEAAGYQAFDAEIVVESSPPGGCCNPGFIEERVTVELTPE